MTDRQQNTVHRTMKGWNHFAAEEKNRRMSQRIETQNSHCTLSELASRISIHSAQRPRTCRWILNVVAGVSSGFRQAAAEALHTCTQSCCGELLHYSPLLSYTVPVLAVFVHCVVSAVMGISRPKASDEQTQA